MTDTAPFVPPAQVPSPIFHACRRAEWAAADPARGYLGSSQDRADGFIHFSTAAQLPQSLAKHRAGQSGLVLLAVDPDRLGVTLRWEPSRGGALFPHLYGALPLTAVLGVAPLDLAADGVHRLPDLAHPGDWPAWPPGEAGP